MIMLFDIIIILFIVILMNNKDLMLIHMEFKQIIIKILYDFLFVRLVMLVLDRFTRCN